MNEYDFTKLNDKEFESLSVDLISKIEGKSVERFKPGRDSGVDGRFFTTSDSEVVIQCKHWVRSGLNALIRNLKSVEIDKVKKLQPSRYIFVTSLELSRHNKKNITNIFAPFIKSESDVFGKEDLNDLLAKYKEIEEKHYKLWLCSTNVLKTIVNSAIVGRSAFKVEAINEFTSKYVRTDGHNRAIEKLEKMSSIIITGEPGIGKTTLADHLCLHYALNSYELIYIQDSISEAEALFHRERKQLFYFDDFLGRNYLSALDRHEDSHVINFIKRVARTKNKRFILTSRSTVLNQGKRLSDLFEIENIERNEYELNIKKLTGLEKAKILYNHLWFSDLDKDYVDELYFHKRYKNIIKHNNYNPRLISFITDSHKIADISSTDYWSYIEDTLANPTDIWGRVYDNLLDDHSRVLARLVAFNGKKIKEDKLKSSFFNFVNRNRQKYGNSDFYAAVKLAIGAVINRQLETGKEVVTYDLFNPALGDFLLYRYSEDENMLYELFESLDTYESLANFKSLLENEIVDHVVAINVLKRLLVNCLDGANSKKSQDYVIKIIHLSLFNTTLDTTVKEQLKYWLSLLNYNNFQLYTVGILSESIKWMIENEIVTAQELALSDLFDSILTDGLDHDDYVSIGNLLDSLDCKNTEYYKEELKCFVVNYWEEMIDQDISNEGKLDEYSYEEDLYYASDALHDHLADKLSEYSIKFEDDDIELICDSCDLREHIRSNRENSSMTGEYNNYAKVTNRSSLSEDDAIDNLFERS